MNETTGSGRVLVCDDEPYILRSLSYVLRKEGFEVCEGRNGQEAIEQALAFHPQLIFLDVMMPLANGFDVCESLRRHEEFHDVPIVMLTAKGQECDRDRGLEVGASHYMTKPFSPSQIVQLARTLLTTQVQDS
ncbi:MAG: response regulator [Planctomycetes bacterium]|nr:response regulator [Planctomycetota bacterium]